MSVLILSCLYTYVKITEDGCFGGWLFRWMVVIYLFHLIYFVIFYLKENQAGHKCLHIWFGYVFD